MGRRPGSTGRTLSGRPGTEATGGRCCCSGDKRPLALGSGKFGYAVCAHALGEFQRLGAELSVLGRGRRRETSLREQLAAGLLGCREPPPRVRGHEEADPAAPYGACLRAMRVDACGVGVVHGGLLLRRQRGSRRGRRFRSGCGSQACDRGCLGAAAAARGEQRETASPAATTAPLAVLRRRFTARATSSTRGTVGRSGIVSHLPLRVAVVQSCPAVRPRPCPRRRWCAERLCRARAICHRTLCPDEHFALRWTPCQARAQRAPTLPRRPRRRLAYA